MAAPKKKRKTKRKSNPTTTTTENPKRRRKRRASNPAPKKSRRRRRSNPSRRRRRSNPSNARETIMRLLPDMKEIAGFIGVNMAMNFAVLRFGGDPGSIMGGSASPTMGAAWTGRQYAIGLATAYAVSKFVAPRLKMDSRTVFRDGVKSLVSRMFWTEGLARNDWLRQTFGAALAVRDDGYGNRWLTLPDGTQVSMAGLQAASPLGQLVGTSTYDGLMPADVYGDDLDELAAEGAEELDAEEAAAADDGGVLREARSIDAGGQLLRGGGRRFQRSNDRYREVYSRYSPY